MIKLSVVIITLNEERNIGRCITSVKDIADEIIVVDSFSTDKTEEISKSLGAKFIQNKFIIPYGNEEIKELFKAHLAGNPILK